MCLQYFSSLCHKLLNIVLGISQGHSILISEKARLNSVYFTLIVSVIHSLFILKSPMTSMQSYMYIYVHDTCTHTNVPRYVCFQSLPFYYLWCAMQFCIVIIYTVCVIGGSVFILCLIMGSLRVLT